MNRLELNGGELIRADAICGYLKAVLKKCDQPAYENDFEEWGLTVFQGPYQANVMKIFEMVRSSTVFIVCSLPKALDFVYPDAAGQRCDSNSATSRWEVRGVRPGKARG